MQRLRSLLSSFDRLSSREKTLIVGLVATFVGILIFAGVFWVSSSLSSLEEDVESGRDSLRAIHARLDTYREAVRYRDEVQRLIDENPISSLRIPINAIAKGITVESTSSDFAGQGKRLSELISYSGRTVETRIEPKSTKGRKRTRRKDDGSGNYEIEQTLEFSEIPLKAIYEFFQELKRSDDLVFARRIDMSRRFNNLEHVRATISVSTIKYREGEPE